MKLHTRFSIFLFCFAFLAAECTAEDLGKGYSRKGGFVFFEGKRIDQEGAHDIKKISPSAISFLVSHSQNACASFQLTFTTGWVSSCLNPGFFQFPSTSAFSATNAA